MWALQWANVLAPELRGQQNKDADHVVLHERVPAPPYDIKCDSAVQARELLQRVQHHLMSLLHVRMLDADLAGSSIEDAEIPPAEVCCTISHNYMHFVSTVLHVSQQSSRALTMHEFLAQIPRCIVLWCLLAKLCKWWQRLRIIMSGFCACRGSHFRSGCQAWSGGWW